MSLYKSSIIGGRNSAGEYDNTSRRGHISVAAAQAIAAQKGWAKAILSHHTADLSGHGRGSEDGRYDLTTGAKISGYIDVDDSADIHEICDEIEGR